MDEKSHVLAQPYQMTLSLIYMSAHKSFTLMMLTSLVTVAYQLVPRGLRKFKVSYCGRYYDMLSKQVPQTHKRESF